MEDGELSTAPFALVVDDDPIILLDASDILIDAGFRTLEARNADEALDLLQEHDGSITLLFTDVQMPGMDGFELARETATRWPHIAIVVASGHVVPAPGDMPEGARFVAKPFSAGMIHEHLQEILPDAKKPEPLKQAGESPL